MEFMDYIVGDALIMIPALYIIGMILKKLETVPDKFIPLILLPLGIAGACVMMGFSVPSIIQGVLVTGAAVYVNQVAKQAVKNK